MMVASVDFGLSYDLEWVGFIIVLLFVAKYVWRGGLGLRDKMSHQIDAIRTQLAAGDEAKAAAAALIDERRVALDAARLEAETIQARATETASAIVADGVHHAVEERERLVQRANAEVDAMRASMQASILAVAGEQVMVAVEAIIEVEVTAVVHRRLIDEAIAATQSDVA
jgi:ATP synthase F0 subunit b